MPGQKNPNFYHFEPYYGVIAKQTFLAFDVTKIHNSEAKSTISNDQHLIFGNIAAA